MGEMLEYELEYHPESWHRELWRNKSKRVQYSISLSKKQREKLRLLGGAVALRKLIDSTPIPDQIK